jgi:hypothetical protein
VVNREFGIESSALDMNAAPFGQPLARNLQALLFLLNHSSRLSGTNL